MQLSMLNQKPIWIWRRLIVCSLLFAFSAVLAQAQEANKYCEASPAIKAALKKISELDDGKLPTKSVREQTLEQVRALFKQYPDDLFVHRRYQDARNNTMGGDPEPLLTEYRERLEKHPDDPVSLYLYGNLLIGTRTKEALGLMEKALKQAPTFARAHQAMFQIYQYPAYRDKAKAQEHLKQVLNACPSTVSLYSSLTNRQIDDPELLRTGTQKLRALLEKSTDPAELWYYDYLWQLEFRLKPVAEHAQVREQVAADVQRLRGLSAAHTDGLLVMMRGGYKQAGNKEGERWAEEELLRRFPNSRAAASLTQERWRAAHPFPTERTPEKLLAYNEVLFSATDHWVRQWPHNLLFWNERFAAANQLPKVTDAEFDKIADDFLRVLDQNPGMLYTSPPLPILVAEAYLKHNLHLDRIPELARQGISEVERRVQRDQQSDTLPAELKEAMSESVKFTRGRSWPLLLEAYLRLNQPNKAREVLGQMAATLAKEKPGETAKPNEKVAYARNQSTYWDWMGRLAEHEQHKLDALTCYQNALAFRPLLESKEKDPKPDELMERTRKLWQAMGGTDDGWKAWLARNEAPRNAKEVMAASAWEPKNKPLPEFTLTDMQGRKWQVADLKGKVAFINLWATWCGPCRLELPFVQKLHEQMKDRKDVLVLTLNVDADLGEIEPFIKENKYTFTVLPALSYVENLLQAISIPRNWVVSADGIWQVEQIGFGGEGEKWMQQTLEAIEKARGGK